MSALANTAVVPAPVGLSDERLAARVATDPTAFIELHERYEQPLLRYTRSLLRDPHDAADAAQDAWTRAFAALRESPVRVLSVRSWLFAVARNACMDRMRDAARCAPADLDERALGASPAPDDVLELRSRAREALGDLARLSERQRAAVVLRELGGLEGDALARALHTDARRASWLLTDARRSLAAVRSGRVLSCETTRRHLDTARVRTRAVRAHLAGCEACDGYARRRVGSRLHLHGIAFFVLALPVRLRALFAGSLAAATLAAGLPAIHHLQLGHGGHHTHPPAASPAPRRGTQAPVVRLPAVPAVRRRARAEVQVARRAPRITIARHAPAWHPAATSRPATSPAPAPVPATAPAPVRGAVEHVTNTVTTIAPAAQPVVRLVTGALADL